MLHSPRHKLVPAVLLVLLALPSLLSPAGASGQDDLAAPARAPAAIAARASSQPMVVVRMRGKDWCGKRCPEWIMAEGAITPGTPERFRRLLAGIGDARLPVVLDSPGGDLEAALEIGRMIRARGLTTIIGRSEVQGCAPREAACSAGRVAGFPYSGYVVPRGACADACLLLLAAGTQRIGYWIGKAAFPAPGDFKTRTAGADAATLVGAYLAAMGISPGLLPRLRRSGLPLDRSEMLHFGLSTGRQRVEDFTGSSICLRPDPAPNCLLLAPARPPARVAGKPQPRKPAPSRSTGVIIWGAIEDM